MNFLDQPNIGGFPGSSARKESACYAGDPDSIPGSGSSPVGGIDYPFQYSWAPIVAQLIKNPPANFSKPFLWVEQFLFLKYNIWNIWMKRNNISKKYFWTLTFYSIEKPYWNSQGIIINQGAASISTFTSSVYLSTVLSFFSCKTGMNWYFATVE